MNKSSNKDVHVTELPLLSLMNMGVSSNAATHPYNSFHHLHPVMHHTASCHHCCSHIGVPFCHIPHHHHQPVLMFMSALTHIHHLMPHPQAPRTTQLLPSAYCWPLWHFSTRRHCWAAWCCHAMWAQATPMAKWPGTNRASKGSWLWPWHQLTHCQILSWVFSMSLHSRGSTWSRDANQLELRHLADHLQGCWRELQIFWLCHRAGKFYILITPFTSILMYSNRAKHNAVMLTLPSRMLCGPRSALTLGSPTLQKLKGRSLIATGRYVRTCWRAIYSSTRYKTWLQVNLMLMTSF